MAQGRGGTAAVSAPKRGRPQGSKAKRPPGAPGVGAPAGAGAPAGGSPSRPSAGSPGPKPSPTPHNKRPGPGHPLGRPLVRNGMTSNFGGAAPAATHPGGAKPPGTMPNVPPMSGGAGPMMMMPRPDGAQGPDGKISLSNLQSLSGQKRRAMGADGAPPLREGAPAGAPPGQPPYKMQKKPGGPGPSPPLRPVGAHPGAPPPSPAAPRPPAKKAMV